jgi:hypothetical protein
MALELTEMQRILAQVTAGEKGPENESNEAKTFRMDVEEDMVEAKKIAKEKGIKNVTFDLSPEWPELDRSLAKFPKGHFGT